MKDLHWLPGGGAFLATGVDFSGMATPQIRQVTYPAGVRTRVTNDLNSYVGVSVSSDGRSLATVQTATVAGVYVAEKPGDEPRRVTGGAGLVDGTTGLAWLATTVSSTPPAPPACRSYGLSTRTDATPAS